MLTKSDLAAYRQCPRRLWLEKHNPRAADSGSATTWRRARDGAIVGEKARELLGPQIIWPKAEHTPERSADAALKQLLAEPTRPGVEIPLVRNDLYARADALIHQAGAYLLQETKASTFPYKKDKLTPDKPDEHHLDDAAIQLWVLQGTEVPPHHAELILLNNQWRYPGNNDYRGLFRPYPLDEDIKPRVAEVPRWLIHAQQLLTGPMPDITTGPQCTKPYACPFHAHCKPLDPPGPEHPIELLPGLAGKNLAKKLEAQGFDSLLGPTPEGFTGKDADLYRRMQTAHRTSVPVLEPNSADALAHLPYPRYFLDFEGIDLPVPHWVGVRPYEQIPFQWSCHIEHADGHFEHTEFRDLTGNDPSIPCIKSLIQTIPPERTERILVYSKTYEEGRLRELGERHPQHAADTRRLIDRLIDLLPLVREHYYHPAMRGSFSIKKVLPTIARPRLQQPHRGQRRHRRPGHLSLYGVRPRHHRLEKSSTTAGTAYLLQA